VPLGLKTAAPNIGSTIWRTVYNQKTKTMYFDSATSPTVFWIPLADLDFTAGAPVKKLALIGGETYNGNAAKQLAPVEPFAFLPAKAE
jgi:choloylglycine hydrolase